MLEAPATCLLLLSFCALITGDPKIATVYLQSRRFSRHSEIAELYSQGGKGLELLYIEGHEVYYRCGCLANKDIACGPFLPSCIIDGIKALIGGVKRAADVLDQDMQKVNRVRQSSGAGAVLHSKTHSLWERDLIEGVPVILASRLQQ